MVRWTRPAVGKYVVFYIFCELVAPNDTRTEEKGTGMLNPAPIARLTIFETLDLYTCVSPTNGEECSLLFHPTIKLDSI
jgi:hypothetical protein